MTITFSINVILLMIGIVVGLFTAIILFFDKANKQANVYLAALVLVCVGTLFHNFLIYSNIYNQKPQLYFLPIILSLGIGPLLYLYVSRLCMGKKIKTQKVLLHLLPVFIQFCIYLFCFLQNADTKYYIYSKYYEPFISPIQNITVYVSVAVYVFLSFREIAFFKNQLNNFYSNSDKIALQWLKKLLIVFIAYYAFAIFFLVISYSFKLTVNYFPSDFIRCIIIFIIAFFAIKQNNLIDIQHNIQSLYEPPLEEKNIVEKSTISLQIETPKPKEFNADLLQKIIDVVENEKLYLNEYLTIGDVATKLGYSTKSVSSTINNGLGKSFSLFINEYRINLFKEKRLSGQFDNLSIMGLAYDCGFNSKSTFNRIFKEITGLSPKSQKSNAEEVPN